MFRSTMVGLALAVSAAIASDVNAQRGVGEQTGVAQQRFRPKLVSIKGTLAEIVSGPCEATTGRAQIGAHIILDTASKEQLNIHLGPSSAVKHITDRLAKGQEITVSAFRTEKMSPHHFVAQALELENEWVPLRDDQLRPSWAGWGRRGGPNWRAASRGYGRGGGAGNRYGWGGGARNRQRPWGVCPWALNDEQQAKSTNQ